MEVIRYSVSSVLYLKVCHTRHDMPTQGTPPGSLHLRRHAHCMHAPHVLANTNSLSFPLRPSNPISYINELHAVHEGAMGPRSLYRLGCDGVQERRELYVQSVADKNDTHREAANNPSQHTTHP
jgi:hypothetical protein